MIEKPFIKLLRSPYSGYFYDANCNQVVAVSDEVFDCLKAQLEDREVTPELSVANEIEALREYGYLLPPQVKTIRHPDTDYLPVYLDRNLMKVTLQLTQNCNLRCKYCIYSESANQSQRTHSAKRMSWETAKKAIDFFAAHSVDSKEVNVGFYGGEPLLEFPLLRKAVEYAEEQFAGKKVTFHMTTNATLLNEEIISFLAKHYFNLLFSMDGPREIHNQNRIFAKDGSGSYDMVLHNLRLIRDRYPDFLPKVSINMVVVPTNDYDAIERIKQECDMLSYDRFRSSIVDTFYDDTEPVYSDDFIIKDRYHNFLGFLSYLKRINPSHLSALAYYSIAHLEEDFQKMGVGGSLTEANAPGGPCLPGQARLLVSVDGEFFPCERVSESSEAMRIGSVDTGFDLEQAKRLLNIADMSSDECIHCWAFQHCLLCQRYSDKNGVLSKEPRLKKCEGVRRNVEYKLRALIMMRELTGGRLYRTREGKQS